MFNHETLQPLIQKIQKTFGDSQESVQKTTKFLCCKELARDSTKAKKIEIQCTFMTKWLFHNPKPWPS